MRTAYGPENAQIVFFEELNRVGSFQNGEQILFIEETDKNFYFITEILFRFLGFGDLKVSIVIEN